MSRYGFFLIAFAILSIGVLNAANFMRQGVAADTALGITDVTTTPTALPTLVFRSLIDASPAEVGQYAIAYTAANFPILSGAPEAILARPILASELPGLGLVDLGYRDNDPPLMLVIVRGSFDRGGSVVQSPLFDTPDYHLLIHYIAYVIDLRAGIPTSISTDTDGSAFRLALNDPSLPTTVPIVTYTPIPTPLLPASLRQSYGRQAQYWRPTAQPSPTILASASATVSTATPTVIALPATPTSSVPVGTPTSGPSPTASPSLGPTPLAPTLVPTPSPRPTSPPLPTVLPPTFMPLTIVPPPTSVLATPLPLATATSVAATSSTTGAAPAAR